MIVIRYLFRTLLIFLLVSPSIAFSQTCSDILKYGIWENFSTSADNSSNSAFLNWRCSNRARSSGISAAYRDPGSAISGAFSSSRSSRSCSFNESQSSYEASSATDWNVASQTIASAWQACVNADGAKAYIVYRSDPKLFVINLEFRSGASATVQARIRTLGGVGLSCSDPVATSGHSFTVTVRKQITCSRADITQAVAIDIDFTGYGETALEVPAAFIEDSDNSLRQIENGALFVLNLKSGQVGGWFAADGTPAYVMARRYQPNNCVMWITARLGQGDMLVVEGQVYSVVTPCDLTSGRLTFPFPLLQSNQPTGYEFELLESGEVARLDGGQSSVVGHFTVVR